MRQQAQADPLLQIPKKEIHFEGNRMSNRDASGHLHETAYTRIEAKATVKHADIIEKGVFAFLEPNKHAADEMRDQAAKMAIDTLSMMTQSVGNVVDNGNKPFTFDTYLQALDTVQMDFDDAGVPQGLTWVTHPDAAPKIQAVVEEALKSPENQKRLKDLHARKKKEWDDRESHRKLVD